MSKDPLPNYTDKPTILTSNINNTPSSSSRKASGSLESTDITNFMINTANNISSI